MCHSDREQISRARSEFISSKQLRPVVASPNDLAYRNPGNFMTESLHMTLREQVHISRPLNVRWPCLERVNRSTRPVDRNVLFRQPFKLFDQEQHFSWRREA